MLKLWERIMLIISNNEETEDKCYSETTLSLALALALALAQIVNLGIQQIKR